VLSGNDVHLSYLKKDEAQQLIEKTKRLHYTTDAIERILTLTRLINLLTDKTQL